MNNIAAILKKQLKDTWGNKTVLIQFIMFPVLTLIMNNAIKIDGMPENFFINLFATMYIGMAPLTSMAAVIAHEYLLGIGSYIWTACMMGAVVICMAGSYKLEERLYFIMIMAVGILASLLIGAAIGIWSKTQIMASSVAVPVMMVFSFMPMLSMFNTTIGKIAKFIYSEQISIMLDRISSIHFEIDNICIMAVNMLFFVVLFIVAYRKYGLE